MARLLTLAGLGLGLSMLAGSWAELLQIAGVPVDIIILAAVALALIDESTTPILFAVYCGLLVDLAYSTIVGLGALATTAAVAAVFFLIRRADHINVLIVMAAGGGAYLIKNLILAIFITASGTAAVGGGVFMHMVLPGTGLAAALVIPAYWLMTRLMRLRFMKKRRILVDEF